VEAQPQPPIDVVRASTAFNNQRQHNARQSHGNPPPAVQVQELEYNVGKARPTGMFKASRDKHWLFHRADNNSLEQQHHNHHQQEHRSQSSSNNVIVGSEVEAEPSRQRVGALDGHGRRRGAPVAAISSSSNEAGNNNDNNGAGINNSDVKGLLFGGGYEGNSSYSDQQAARVRPKSAAPRSRY
jgi:hypothetical protein